MTGWWLVPGDARALRYPDRCACCAAETTDRWDTVPYCRECRAHLPRVGPILLSLATAAVGLGTMYAMRVKAPFASLFVHVCAVAVAALAVPITYALLSRSRKLDARHAGRLQAAEITNEGLLVRSRAWAESVATLNGVTARSARESVFARGERLLPYLAVAGAVAALWQWYPSWHVRLWIDNGTPSAVEVRVDDHVVADLPAGHTERVELPRAMLHVTTTAGDSELLDTRESSTWVLNVARAHCYKLRTTRYSEGGGLDLFPAAEERLYDARLFAIEADWFFQPAPAQITVKSSNATRQLAKIPTPRTALEIVPCL